MRTLRDFALPTQGMWRLLLPPPYSAWMCFNLSHLLCSTGLALCAPAHACFLATASSTCIAPLANMILPTNRTAKGIWKPASKPSRSCAEPRALFDATTSCLTAQPYMNTACRIPVASAIRCRMEHHNCKYGVGRQMKRVLSQPSTYYIFGCWRSDDR